MSFTVRNEMPKALKNKWVQALRSGDYKQGSMYFHNTVLNRHCIMGVLAAVGGYSTFGRDTFQGDAQENHDSWVQWLSDNGVSFIINDQTCSSPYLTYFSRTEPALFLNDFGRVTFKEFADMIDKQITGI
jgi:hypothetical protein